MKIQLHLRANAPACRFRQKRGKREVNARAMYGAVLCTCMCVRHAWGLHLPVSIRACSAELGGSQEGVRRGFIGQV
eukprot:5314114-Pyramimonas_sp.AAC.1